VIDPAAQPERAKAWFGATVTLADEDDNRRTVTLVGEDETDAANGRIAWTSPVGRAIRGAAVGDLRRVTLPGGERELEIVSIDYPESR
jgi:transcription elongation factor GreB